jgi:hypothetical protein
MSDREASFLICDDLLVSLSGKFFIQGVYTGDIVIPGEEQKVNQLIILLQLSTPIQKPFQKTSTFAVAAWRRRSKSYELIAPVADTFSNGGTKNTFLQGASSYRGSESPAGSN